MRHDHSTRGSIIQLEFSGYNGQRGLFNKADEKIVGKQYTPRAKTKGLDLGIEIDNEVDNIYCIVI